ncbi:hypothetical protein M0802_015839 [Mischocyttarus mexicanus]|nr:hypothetical protein M0802_015839 [Mischocyttarus mexicanus]
MEAVVIFIGVLTVLVLCVNEPVKGFPGQCMLPLGMEEGRIPDDAITASSSYEMKSVGPQNARTLGDKRLVISEQLIKPLTILQTNIISDIILLLHKVEG